VGKISYKGNLFPQSIYLYFMRNLFMMASSTYSFQHAFTDQVITFYSRMNDCPDYAARHFWRMYENESKPFGRVDGELAEIFIKSNPEQMMFSNGHDAHDDTQYRYCIDAQGFLIAMRINTERLCDRKFDVFFSGHYAKFINQYGSKIICGRLYELSEKGKRWIGRSYATIDDIEKDIQEMSVHGLLDRSTPAGQRLEVLVNELRRMLKEKESLR
jgi:hypothetical protein